MNRDKYDIESDDAEIDRPKSTLEKRIFELTLELHKDGHTRRDIVYWLRDVADTYEDYWEGHDTYNLSPSEKDVVLPGDFDDE